MICVDLPWGRWRIRSQDGAVVEVCPAEGIVTETATELEKETARQLIEYAAGQRTVFTVEASPRGTPFQQAVWRELCRVPYGCSISYSALACWIGRPNASRAVARAVAANPCLVLVPCHRVIGIRGSITGFSAGLSLKRRLLTLEGIPWKE